MKKRLSKLQKIILITLYEKDKIDEKGFWASRGAKPPYWHQTRDRYTTQSDGHIFHNLVEKGVANTVKDVSKHKEESFLPAFSRSIRNLHLKGLVEKPEYLRGKRFDCLKLTKKALMLISDTSNLTIKKSI